ncbi:MAG: hypothetical protein Q8L26_00225 [Candidatus Omnitrophota bacterium]|nr:hypothetical protein [Candidatus Omnitrophota bacterium]
MWKTILFEPVSNLLNRIGTLVSNLLLVIVILVIGWLIAKLVQNLITRLFKLIKIDSIADQIGANSFLSKGGIKLTLAELIGAICYWLVVLIVIMVAVNAVGLTVAADLLNRMVLYVPNVIIAIIVLALGIFLSTFLAATVRTAAINAGIEQAKILAKVVEVAIAVLAVVIALEQLSIGAAVINILITIVLASLGIGFALAFGLGCKDLVGKMVSEAVEKLRKK